MRRCVIIVSFSLILTVCWSNRVIGQFYGPPRKLKQNVQTVYFELFGNGIFFSLNYDIIHKNHLGTRFGAGFDFTGLADNNSWYSSNNNYEPFKSVSIVIMENYYAGKGRTRLELGAGGVFGHIEDISSKDIVQPPAFTFTIGVRTLPAGDKHMSFKFAFTPFIARGRIYPYAGISVGWGVNTLF